MNDKTDWEEAQASMRIAGYVVIGIIVLVIWVLVWLGARAI